MGNFDPHASRERWTRGQRRAHRRAVRFSLMAERRARERERLRTYPPGVIRLRASFRPWWHRVAMAIRCYLGAWGLPC